MSEVVLVAIAAAIGNFLQGWDNSALAGSVLFFKKEFELETKPTIEGLILAMSLIGGTVITTISGPVSDRIGRRPVLIISSVLYFVSGLIMLLAPNVYVLLLARLIDGFGIGLAITIVPVYISETAPPEIRGQLNTLPQFTGSSGMFLSYCMVFAMSLMDLPNWRFMLGILSIISVFYFGLTVLYLPESPRWLVSKGRMIEAKRVLQRLRGKEDVTGELALLVEGLDVGADASIEEYIISRVNEPNDNREMTAGKDQIRFYSPKEGVSWVAKPVNGQSAHGIVSHHGSLANQSSVLMDPLVTLFDSVHEKLPETGSMRSMLFSNMGSMFYEGDHQSKNEQWDVESQRDGDGYTSDAAGENSDDNLHSPLLSRQTSVMDKGISHSVSHGSHLDMSGNSRLMEGYSGEAVSHADIGGGWQLVWKWSEKVGEDGKKEGGYQRIYLHQEAALGSRPGSLVSVPGGAMPEEGEIYQAAALVSQPALCSQALMSRQSIEPAMVHPPPSVTKGPSWTDLLEPGVKRALLVGMGVQILQQMSGINSLLNYGPQILEQAGVAVLLSNMSIGSTSASLLLSAFTSFFMLPCIAVSMWLMDIAGRRSLLLSTIPILIAALIALVLSSTVSMGSVVNATISTIGVVVFTSIFVMAFGIVPNILCSEIFPTRVRGLCITICALTYWIGNIIITYTTPLLLTSIGLSGVFSIYVIGCTISYIFVYFKVPETKGMPLEVICELFAMGATAKQQAVEAVDN
ncbi:monosaccharide-sensing protein 2-like [Quercus robur]|uniref:monosaccharide-sensing protein 2-like n=1 Tax=Quercus robur TaxID=38942 RepID=UPI00216238D0|nr:monosaccharide-sensing protein 2-like [Quercus robur]